MTADAEKQNFVEEQQSRIAFFERLKAVGMTKRQFDELTFFHRWDGNSKDYNPWHWLSEFERNYQAAEAEKAGCKAIANGLQGLCNITTLEQMRFVCKYLSESRKNGTVNTDTHESLLDFLVKFMGQRWRHYTDVPFQGEDALSGLLRYWIIRFPDRFAHILSVLESLRNLRTVEMFEYRVYNYSYIELEPVAKRLYQGNCKPAKVCFSIRIDYCYDSGQPREVPYFEIVRNIDGKYEHCLKKTSNVSKVLRSFGYLLPLLNYKLRTEDIARRKHTCPHCGKAYYDPKKKEA